MTQAPDIEDGAGFRGRWLLALLAIAALPFLPSLRDPLFADDYLHIERTETLRSGPLVPALRSWVLRAEDAAAWWTPPDLAIQYFRPLVSLLFLIDHWLWGLGPFGYHATNLLLHLLSTLVCFGLARRILGHGLSAWTAAALFAVHPCHTEAVVWVSGRTDLWVGLLYGTAVLFYLSGQRLGLCAVFFCLALLAKEMALTLPFVLLLHNLIFRQTSFWRRASGPAFLAALSLIYLGGRYALLGGLARPPHPFAHGFGDPDALEHILRAPLLYLADLVLFVPPDPVVTYPFWKSHPAAFALLAILTVLTLAGSVRAVPDRRIRLFALGWITITLLPVLPVSVGERFLYLPSMGYCILVGARLPRSWAELRVAERRTLALVAGVVFCVALGKNLVFGSLAGHSRLAIDDALLEVDRQPAATLVLVADLPAASALAFPHALRLERPDRGLEVQILSIAPQFLGTDHGFQSSLSRSSPARFVLRATGEPYLRSYIERAFLGEGAPPLAGQVFPRPGFKVRVLEASDGQLRALEVELEEPPEKVLLLRGSGFRLLLASPEAAARAFPDVPRGIDP